MTLTVIPFTKGLGCDIRPLQWPEACHVTLRLGKMAGEPAAGAMGLGCDIRLPQGLETWVVTSAGTIKYRF